jgi:acyl-CoA thioester hydrolase
VTERSVYDVQVRWSDPDQMGHVNHARYLTYFEDARMELIARSPSRSAEGGGRGVIAARVAVDYLRPVIFRSGLTLRVETVVGRLGTSSFTLLSDLYEGDQPMARAEVVLVGYSYESGQSRPLDEEERAYWGGYL